MSETWVGKWKTQDVFCEESEIHPVASSERVPNVAVRRAVSEWQKQNEQTHRAPPLSREVEQTQRQWTSFMNSKAPRLREKNLDAGACTLTADRTHVKVCQNTIR